MEKKLSFKETMLLSKVLHDVELVKFIDSKLLSDELNGILEKTEQQKDKLMKIITSALSYIVSNLWKSSDSLEELILTYMGIKKIDEINSNDIYEIFVEIVKNGIPKIILDMFNLDDIKKKLT